MEDWQEWDYLEDEILVRKRRKIYYLQSLQVQHDKFLCHHPYLSLSSKAYSSGDHLFRDADVGERTAEYSLQKQHEHLVRGSVESRSYN